MIIIPLPPTFLPPPFEDLLDGSAVLRIVTYTLKPGLLEKACSRIREDSFCPLSVCVTLGRYSHPSGPP